MKPMSRSATYNYTKTIENYVYSTADKIGIGQFSSVYKGKHLITGEQVAVKVVDLSEIPQKIFVTLLHNEIQILKTLKHRNLLELKDVFQTKNNIYLITEYCDRGNLQEYITKNGSLKEEQAMKILRHLINGISYMQKQSIVHRDIKPANILITGDVPKFADFGFAITKQFSIEQKELLMSFAVGTPLYMAPETLIGNSYSYKSDLWALGTLFYEMLFGTTPFHSMDHNVLMNKVQQYVRDKQLPMPRNKIISTEAKEILKGLLEPDPKKRMDLGQLSRNRLVQKREKSLEKQPEETQKLMCDRTMSQKGAPQQSRMLFTRENFKIHPNTYKFDRAVNQLCYFLDRVVLNIQDDPIFNIVESYFSGIDENSQEVQQFKWFKPKLFYLINRLQYLLQYSHGIQQDKIDMYANIKWFVPEHDDISFNDIKNETVMTTRFLSTTLFYLKIVVLCFRKFLKLKLNNLALERVRKHSGSINNLCYLVQAHKLISSLKDREFLEVSGVSSEYHKFVPCTGWTDLQEQIENLL